MSDEHQPRAPRLPPRWFIRAVWLILWPTGRRLVHGRAATGDERSRLWGRWREIDTNLDAYAALRSSETRWWSWSPRPGPTPPSAA